jgi:N-glycosidase YbiA
MFFMASSLGPVSESSFISRIATIAKKASPRAIVAAVALTILGVLPGVFFAIGYVAYNWNKHTVKQLPSEDPAAAKVESAASSAGGVLPTSTPSSAIPEAIRSFMKPDELLEKDASLIEKMHKNLVDKNLKGFTEGEDAISVVNTIMRATSNGQGAVVALLCSVFDQYGKGHELTLQEKRQAFDTFYKGLKVLSFIDEEAMQIMIERFKEKVGVSAPPAPGSIPTAVVVPSVAPVKMAPATTAKSAQEVALDKIATRDKFVWFYDNTSPTTEFLGNYFEAPVEYERKIYKCSEIAYQAAKFPKDSPIREQIRKAKDAKDAWQIAQDNKALVTLPLTETARVMEEIVQAKFAQNPNLIPLLLATKDAYLVEHVPKFGRDNYWADGGDGNGENMLGRILMKVRDEKRTGQPQPLPPKNPGFLASKYRQGNKGAPCVWPNQTA